MGVPVAVRAGSQVRSRTFGIARQRIAAFALLGLLSVTSFALWTVVPAAVLWIMPRVVGGSFGLTLIAVIVAMIALGVQIGRFNQLYCHLVGVEDCRPLVAWRRPLSHKDEGRAHVDAMQVALTLSVLAAALTLAIWFLFFADCSGGACYGARV